MKLYLIHCGFYDQNLCDGLYESHANFFVAAEHFEDARKKAKLIPEFQSKKMHVDGVQEINLVEGWEVSLIENPSLIGKSQIINYKHRDLAQSSLKKEQDILLNSAIETNLKMSHENRISAHENARDLMEDLQKAGRELRAKPQNPS